MLDDPLRGSDLLEENGCIVPECMEGGRTCNLGESCTTTGQRHFQLGTEKRGLSVYIPFCAPSSPPHSPLHTLHSTLYTPPSNPPPPPFLPPKLIHDTTFSRITLEDTSHLATINESRWFGKGHNSITPQTHMNTHTYQGCQKQLGQAIFQRNYFCQSIASKR